MHRTSKLLSVACVLALTACAAPPGQYQPPPRPKIDPLPTDLQLTARDRSLCQRLLLTFWATEQQLRDSCGDTSASSSGSKNAER